MTLAHAETPFLASLFQSLTRVAMNVAQLCGPFIGGVLYGEDAFYRPFVVMGVVQVIMSAASIPILPECRVRASNKDESKGRRGEGKFNQSSN